MYHPRFRRNGAGKRETSSAAQRALGSGLRQAGLKVDDPAFISMLGVVV
jgi:hypothetical protein